MIPWLDPRYPGFPPVTEALKDPNGLLAAGGALTPEWLLAAYPRAIFPWYSEDQPILWWSPDPRMVVYPEQIRITRSLGKTLRNGQFEIRCDTAFREVITACAGPRAYAQGTWIQPEIIEAYCRLHEMGWAHSVETWSDGRLVGGLYGLALGKAFFGESMFHRATDASKIAFVHLARALEREKFSVIDCQMTTAHLASLGGREISRAELVEGLKRSTQVDPQPKPWPENFVQADW